MKYFIAKSTGVILSSDNPKVVEQYESHTEAYTPCTEDGKPVAAKAKPGSPATGKGAGSKKPQAPATGGDAPSSDQSDNK